MSTALQQLLFESRNIIFSVLAILSINANADNPIVSHVYTADPAARVVHDRIYVMVTHDKDGQSGYSSLTDYYLFSSDDMVNWQDHGIVFDVKRDSTWAKLAYAPDFIERDGKYYLYYPNGGDSIGVAVADKPEGPYIDPLGKALISRSTPGAETVKWVFDPGIFIDDDGSAYLYFGGAGPGNLRVIRLNNDMISINGTAQTIDAPYFFEAPYMKKRNGVYYLSYSTNGDNGSITIDYLTSNNPMTGFKHQGTVLGNPWNNRGNNNHHSMIEWNDQWYMFYHNRGIADERGAGTFERSINVDLLAFNGDKLVKVSDSKEGVPAIKQLNPFTPIQAETMDNEEGIETARSTSGNMYVQFDKNDWVQISNVDFDNVANSFTAKVAAATATSIDLILDNMKSPALTTLSISASGGLESWQTISLDIPNIAGKHDLYIRANARMNIDWYQFSQKTPSSSSSSTSSSASSSSSSNSSSGKATTQAASTDIFQFLLLACFGLFILNRHSKKNKNLSE